MRVATGEFMKSDFSAARLHLDRAYDYLRGDDPKSREICEALNMLIEAVAVAECTLPHRTATLLRFPRKA